MIVDRPIKGTCVFTGEKVCFDGPCGFFDNQDMSRPVSEKHALEVGFTVDPPTLEKIQNLLDEGIKFEEVQESAHHEIDFLEEDS
ncbi:MAG: hypothetical protein JW822_04510 [Spirochaetales bacterium]|nr:hypothetical protein [Spirochaetales bacterium]